MSLDALGKCCRDTLFNTTLALSFLGRFEESLKMLNRLPNLGKGQPQEAYQAACLKSRLGLYSEALAWLDAAIRHSPTYSAKSLVDSDLQPLWKSLQGRAMTAGECYILLNSTFAKLRTLAKGRSCECELDENDFRELPEGWRKLFRFVPARGAYFIHALTAFAHPREHAALEAWHRQRVERSLQCIDRAREAAARKMQTRLTPPPFISLS